MAAADLSGLSRIRAARDACARAILAACEEYANGGNRAAPIVRRHFTKGNAGRYGWPPLSPRYAKAKEGATKDLKRAMRAEGKAVPQGKGLPMLVSTGRLRDAIAGGRRASITRIGPEAFLIRWPNDPPYAIFHHEGTGKMPRRSPIWPNAEDRAAILAAARRYLSAAVGTASAIPLGQFGDRARRL